MSTSKIASRLRVPVVAALGCALVIAVAPTASARPGASVLTYVYSDASMSTWVGSTYLQCGGHLVQKGQTNTGFAEVISVDPC